jgi:hypothetical protein
MSRIVTLILICHRHNPIDSINLLGSWRRHNVFPVRYGQTYVFELSFKEKDMTMDNVQDYTRKLRKTPYG